MSLTEHASACPERFDAFLPSFCPLKLVANRVPCIFSLTGWLYTIRNASRLQVVVFKG